MILENDLEKQASEIGKTESVFGTADVILFSENGKEADWFWTVSAEANAQLEHYVKGAISSSSDQSFFNL